MTALPVTPAFRLDGRRALVTGAGRGIGLACAAALAGVGAEVTLLARSAQEVSQIAAEIRASGGEAVGHTADVTDVEATAAWVSHQPPFDILVNNAGANRPGPFLETRIDDFDTVFDLNVRGAYFLTQAVAARQIEERRRGSIIMMSSQMGHVGAVNRSVYCATKHAVEGMTKAIAAELGSFGIRVNSICPTFIETPMTKPFFEDEAFRAWALARIKVGRIGRVEDVMGAVIFLASDASALMTGSALMLDGGWTGTS